MVTYAQHRKRIDEEIKCIIASNILKDKRVFIFGYGILTQYVANCLSEEGIPIEGYLENDSSKWGNNMAGAEVISPSKLPKGEDIRVVIYSRYDYEMIEQLLSENYAAKEQIVHLKYVKACYDDFWMDESYETALSEMRSGEAIYKRIKKEDEFLLIATTASCGDHYFWRLTLDQFLKKHGINKYKIVVASNPIKDVLSLFNEEAVIILTMEEIDNLLRYVMFVGESNIDCFMIYPQYACVRRSGYMAMAMGRHFEEIFPKYVFCLGDDYEPHFPELNKDREQADRIEKKLAEIGVKKGEGILLSPYSNSTEGLPKEFWDDVAEKLKEKGYRVFTNVAGSETPVDGTEELRCSFRELPSYLEYLGNTIALKSGYCEIIGHVNCRQVIVHREVVKHFDAKTNGFEQMDMRKGNLSPDAIQFIYDDKDYSNTLKEVVNALPAL